MLRKKHLLKALPAMMLLSFANASMAQNPVIEINSGKVEGVSEGSIEVFKGIPYAKPPVDELRWRAPQPVDSWANTIEAKNFIDDCAQQPFPNDVAPSTAPFSENCLGVNVWKPQGSTDEKLPVMVWIHGGGHVNGGGSPLVYDLSAFAQQGIVAVSFNYRLGRFGFFAHPALTAEQKGEVLGNYGLLDQVAALEWVKKNIASFNGDPENVTVAGESAGGLSIHSLMTSSLVDDLFQKAIIQSGSGRVSKSSRLLSDTNAFGQPSAESVGVAFAEKHGIQDDDPNVLGKLRALSTDEVVDGLNMFNEYNPTYVSGAFIDGKLVEKDPQEYYKAEKKLNIPLLVGYNEMEIGFTPKVESFDQALQPLKLEPSEKEKALAIFKKFGANTPQEVAQTIGSDTLMVEPARFVMRSAVAQGADVYGYRFAYVADADKNIWPAAFHSTEIPFAFNTLEKKFGENLTAVDKELAKLMNQYWVNFIKTGSPNGDDLPKWDPYKASEENLLLFSREGVKDVKMIAEPWSERLDLITESW